MCLSPYRNAKVVVRGNLARRRALFFLMEEQSRISPPVVVGIHVVGRFSATLLCEPIGPHGKNATNTPLYPIRS